MYFNIAGPFVVNYDNHNWFLLSQKVGTLPEKIRIQLLHDSMKLALSSKLSYITALNMTLFLRYEQAPAVWKTFYPLADQFRKLLDGTEAAKPFDVRMMRSIVRLMIRPKDIALKKKKTNIHGALYLFHLRLLECQLGKKSL